MAKYFQNFLKLDLIKSDKWAKFRECFYRRNAIVHNNAFTDDEYREATNYNGPRQRLDTTESYLLESFEIFVEFSTRIQDFLSEKYGEEFYKTHST